LIASGRGRNSAKFLGYTLRFPASDGIVSKSEMPGKPTAAWVVREEAAHCGSIAVRQDVGKPIVAAKKGKTGG
jgi:hypothetical protein